MQRVSSADFVRKFSAFSDEALTESLVLTKNGRDRLVVIGIENYKRLLSLAIVNAKSDDSIKDLVEEFEDFILKSYGS